MKHVTLPGGDRVAALGQGTWFMGDDPNSRPAEIDALRTGIDCGLTLIDTAEMYGNGRAERLVGEAIAGRRDAVYLVSKVLPQNAGTRAAMRACEASLERLGTDHLDLYLLHWPGEVAFAETIDAFERLQAEGKIRCFGVSNLDADAIARFHAEPGGEAVQVNQLLYNLAQRGIEWQLLPWQNARGIATLAYSPFAHGDLLRDERLAAFARERTMTPAQAALAWLVDRQRVIPIPKSARSARVRANATALETSLDAADRCVLDDLFPPPDGPCPLQIT